MAQKVVLDAINYVEALTLALTCPHCGRQSNLEPVGILQDIRVVNKIDGEPVKCYLGMRRCPNMQCYGQIYFQQRGNQPIETFPSIRIGFDTTDVPKPIVACFEEAVSCESVQCYTASAVMVRKTLEMICEDRQASGNTLVERLRDLQSQLTLPPALFKAMDNLRILGNDAAHVKLKDFDKIGRDELEVAIDLTKEILKGIYQMDSIVGRLEKLKRNKTEE